MRHNHFKILVPGLFAASALTLAMSAVAQTPPPTPAAKSHEAAPKMGHHKDGAPVAKHAADMKADCEAMMAKKREMQAKLESMDATLDKLVGEMNAAKGSKDVDAMEKPMAAVINELVAQRKVFLSMKTEMDSAMMAHMARHMDMHGEKGAMECPMMKMGSEPEPKK